MRIAGRSALVTGATGGLGQAVARALAHQGARLTLTGRRADVLEPLAIELGARSLPADLAEDASVIQLAVDAGDVDILVSNAALPASGELEDFTPVEIERALAVNLRAPMLLTRLLVEGMRRRRCGHLVFVGSIGGKAAAPLASIYGATKFGLRGFALSLRQDLHDTCVGVSLVLPGPIRDAGMFAEAGAELPRGLGSRAPDDVAKAVVRAIRDDRAEVMVAPMAVTFAAALAALSPRLGGALQRRSGARSLMAALAEAQRDKR